MMTNKKYQKCKERRKYYLLTLLSGLVVLFFHELLEFLLFLIENDFYVYIRDRANKSENVQFLSSAFTLLGFSAFYGLGKLYNRFVNREKQLTKHINLISKKDNIKEKIKEKNIQKDELEKQEKELKEKTIEKGQELSRKVFKKEDYSLLLNEIKTLEKELKDTQEELSKLANYPS